MSLQTQITTTIPRPDHWSWPPLPTQTGEGTQGLVSLAS